jgi:hypothetical protein
MAGNIEGWRAKEMRRGPALPWSTNRYAERSDEAARSIGMVRLDTSKAGQLRVLAEQFRRRAAEMTLLNYIKLMHHTADDLDAEASAIEHSEPIRLGSRLDIRI